MQHKPWENDPQAVKCPRFAWLRCHRAQVFRQIEKNAKGGIEVANIHIAGELFGQTACRGVMLFERRGAVSRKGDNP